MGKMHQQIRSGVLYEMFDVKAKIVSVSMLTVLMISVLFVSAVSCIQIGDWNVELLGISSISKADTIQQVANLTSNIAIESVELSYTFTEQSQPVNVSMSLLNSSSWQGSTSTLWSAEFPTPNATFNLMERFYVTNTVGNTVTFQNSFGQSITSGSIFEPQVSLPIILLLSLFVAIVASLAVTRRHHKDTSEEPHIQ